MLILGNIANRQSRVQHKVIPVGLPPEVVAKRTKRHLDELEVSSFYIFYIKSLTTAKRSNYAEPSFSFFGEEEGSGKTAKGRTRTAISDTRTFDGKKKKSTMNIRTALLYRKTLNTLIEDSVSNMLKFF